MLLVRSLLVNKHQNLDHVQLTLLKVVNRLDPIVLGIDPQDDWTLHQRVSARLKEEGNVFESSSFLYQQKLGTATGPSEVQEIWCDTLILILKLVSCIPSFSVCGDPGQFSGKHAHVPLEQVLPEAESLAERLRVELWETGKRNWEVGRACDRVQAVLTPV